MGKATKANYWSCSDNPLLIKWAGRFNNFLFCVFLTSYLTTEENNKVEPLL